MNTLSMSRRHHFCNAWVSRSPWAITDWVPVGKATHVFALGALKALEANKANHPVTRVLQSAWCLRKIVIRRYKSS